MLGKLEAPVAAARAHQELIAYWSRLRAPGRLPGRAHIDPCDFKRHLPTVSLIDVIHPETEGARLGYRLRLAGTGLYPVYGCEITGKGLEDVYDADAADYWRRELDAVVAGGRPAVGVHSMAWRGQHHLSILWLRLPLASDGERVDMILGYDAPIGMRAAFGPPSGIKAA